jgi:hypothetical protein
MKNPLLILALMLIVPTFTFAQKSIEGSWKAEMPTEDGGTVIVKITMEENKYTVDFGADGKAEIQGGYEIDGDKVTIWDTEGENACASDQKGVYSFTNEAGTLTMNRVTDDCPGRGGEDGKMVMTSWTNE